MNLKSLEIKELLQLQGEIINELIERGIARTQNNPLGDYTEWLVAQSLNQELEPNSKAGYDALNSEGIRIQIKGRRLTSRNPSRQLSAIGNKMKWICILFFIKLNVLMLLLTGFEETK